MDTKQKHTPGPKFLAPYVCPECGKRAEVEDMQDKNNATFWRLVCNGCGLLFKQWTSRDVEPTSLEYQGDDYPLDAAPDPSKDALLAACKRFLRPAVLIDARLDLEKTQAKPDANGEVVYICAAAHGSLKRAIAAANAAIDLAEKGA